MYKNSKHILKVFLLAIIVLNPVFSSQAQQKKFKVVIDAGHGGHDTGTPGTKKLKKKEKDVALAVALAVNKKLKQYSFIKPILTRKKDVFLELYDRANIANKEKEDLFISIHCNANNSSHANGSETFVLGIHRNKDNLEVAKRENSVIKLEKDNKLHYEGFDPNHPESFIGLSLMQETFLDQSIRLASTIQKHYKKTLKNKIKDRSVQQAGFAVLRLTYMPSVLTEIGFLTNPSEEKYLQSKKGQDKIAQSIADAVVEYYKFIKANTQEVKSVADTKKEVVKTTKKTNSHQNGVIFKVQIAASVKKIPLNSYKFKGVKDLSMLKIGKWYKYYSGHSNNFQSIKKLQNKIRKGKFKSAFIVAFKNGKKISIKEALKKQ